MTASKTRPMKQDMVYLLPAINKIIFDAEARLSRLAGMRVTIKLSYEKADMGVNGLEEAICRVFGVSWSQLISKKRTKELVMARMLYAYYAYYDSGLRMHEISKRLRRRDHTAIVHYLKLYRKLLKEKDRHLTSYINRIELEFKSA